MKRVQIDTATRTSPGRWIVWCEDDDEVRALTDVAPGTIVIDEGAGRLYVADRAGKLK